MFCPTENTKVFLKDKGSIFITEKKMLFDSVGAFGVHYLIIVLLQKQNNNNIVYHLSCAYKMTRDTLLKLWFDKGYAIKGKCIEDM